MEISVNNYVRAPDDAIMRAAKLAATVVLPSFATEDTTPITLAPFMTGRYRSMP